MIILAIRTDKPEAEVYLYDKELKLAGIMWQAHRQLAETLHLKINQILLENQKSLEDIERIVVYEGPGSFTGLRIGISVANALSYSLDVPIVSSTGTDWIKKSLLQINSGNFVQPVYGAEPHITEQKK